MKPSRAATRRPLPGSPFTTLPPPPPESFAVHDQVTHDSYGLGVVLGVEGDVAVLVDFHPRRIRVIIPCAKLTKL